MKEKIFNKKTLIIIICVFCFCLIEISCITISSALVKFNAYKNRVFPNTYLGTYKLSGVNYEYLSGRIDLYTEGILNNKIILKDKNDEYIYEFKDLGLNIDKEKIIKQIKKDQKDISLFKKIKRVNGKKKKVYNIELKYDKDKLVEFVNGVKAKVDTPVVEDSLYMSPERVLSYVPGRDGFTLNADKMLETIESEIKKGAAENIEIELIGERVEVQTNEGYKSIDTIVSSFVTEFNPYITRATNLITGLGYIDGAIVQPGEIFSFYNYAGPYGKKGYVFYYEFVGNGVCQIATTTYNAALLGGLEIVKRYPHKKKSVYVAGGLDATVASYSSGWNVDMQFKNTYKYPIYISAYAVGGEAHVDFWSNHDAKEGKTYTTESVQIGYRGYNTYLHTYKDGAEISRDLITTTWYSED